MGLRDEGLRGSLRPQGLKQGGLRGSLRNLNTTGPDIPDSGVLRYTFDDANTSGSTASDLWGNNDGVINGATSGQSGLSTTYDSGESYSFDGVDDNVSVSDSASLNPTSGISYGGWVEVGDSSASDSVVLSKSDSIFTGVGYQISIHNGNVRARIDTTTDNLNILGGSPPSNSPIHVMATYNGLEFVVYLDGVSVASASDSGDINHTSNALRIGVSDGNHLSGFIDDVRLYNRGLTATEVSNLYSMGNISG